MKLNNGWGSGIGYKSIAYRSSGTMIYEGTSKFQISPYKVPNYNFIRCDYNLIFNLNE